MVLKPEVRERLEKPFETSQVKSRKGLGGSRLDYIEAHSVIQRLNDSFDGSWSFEIISHEMQGSHIVVLGKLTYEGISKMQFGGKDVAVYGAKHSRAGEVIDLADDFKAATSDALKKCATLFGVALFLYDSSPTTGETDQPTGKGKKRASESTNGANLGEVKNMVMEKEREVEETTGLLRNDLRQEKLGDKSLDHSIEDLRSYYGNLQKALKGEKS